MSVSMILLKSPDPLERATAVCISEDPAPVVPACVPVPFFVLDGSTQSQWLNAVTNIFHVVSYREYTVLSHPN